VAHLVITTVLLMLVLWIGTARPIAGYGLLFWSASRLRVPLAAARHPLWIAAAAAVPLSCLRNSCCC
jgi:hypothetical protein